MEDVEDDIDEISDSDSSKATARLFDGIDNLKAGVLPQSKFGELIETLGAVFCSKYMAVNLWKVDPN